MQLPAEAKRKGPKRRSGKNSRLLQKARKFGKQGRLGKGFEVDTETYNYFLRVLEIWKKNEFDDEEEKAAFISNTFAQTEGHEVDYSSNQMTSRVLETILPSAQEDVLVRFCNSFGPSLRTVCTDPFASHVLEKLLEIGSMDEWTERSAKVEDWFRQTSKFVINNMEEFAFDPYANHVLRKVCGCLVGSVQETGQGGVTQNQNSSGGKGKVSTSASTTPNLYGERRKNRKNEEIFGDFYQRLLAWPQLFDLFGAELTSGLVQTALKCASKVDPEVLGNVTVEDGILKVQKALGDELDLNNTTHANLHTRVLEVCLGLSTKTWKKLFETYFQGKLITFGVHEKGKFSVKKVVETCPDKAEFEAIFDELHPGFEQLYKAGSYSTFSSLAESCKRFQTRQSQFLQGLVALLDSDEEKNASRNVILRIAIVGGKLELKEDGTPKYLTQFIGTQILQHALDFHKPSMITSALLDMDGSDMAKLALDPKGSHIFHSYFNSSTVGEKNKDKLFNRLKEHFHNFSMNKFGSRIMDTIWAWASLKNKSSVASALTDRIAQLSSNQYGKFIVEKCALHVFKRDPKLWAESIDKTEKRKSEAASVFSEVLDEVNMDQDAKKKKKKRKSDTEHEIKAEIDEDQATLNQSTEEPDESSQRTKSKKKKKRKNSEEVEESVDCVDMSQPLEEETPRKKKKTKRKHEEEPVSEMNHSMETETEPADISEDIPSERKKKRKKNKHQTEDD